MSKWRCFASTDELDRALARHIAARLRGDIQAHGRAGLAVSGGSTPTGMFGQLSRCQLDWAKVWLTLVDERRVATDSADSNELLVRRKLLQNHATAAHFVSMATACDGSPGSLAELERQIAALPKPLTVVVLGMGSDGHTASWFPGADNLGALLNPDGEAEVAITNPVTAPHSRITLTLPAVLNSREIVVHITGEDKKALLERAGGNYPVSAIITQDLTPATIWWAP